jgi:tetratricopeptide (TPR) repeat protein
MSGLHIFSSLTNFRLNYNLYTPSVMKYFYYVLLGCIALQSCKQKDDTKLVANKRFVESVNHWTALYTGKDSIYRYGYIYMDPHLGLAVHSQGTFKIASDNVYEYNQLPAGAIRNIKLKNSQAKVAWIPESKFVELQIEAKPKWLDSMKIDTTSPAYLLKWAYTYNDGHENAKALPYLERVKKIDPNFPGLDIEYAYYYDGLHQYDKTEELLRQSLNKRPNDFAIYKSLIFAEVFSNNMVKAEQTYQQALPYCTTDQKAELSYNICLMYYKQKNPKFTQWANEAKKWETAGSPQMQRLDKMLSESPAK